MGVSCSYQRLWKNTDGNSWHCPSRQGTQHKLIPTLGGEIGQWLCSFISTFIQWAHQNQEHNSINSATKRHRAPSSSGAGLVFETSCLSSLLPSILSVFPAARFLLRFCRRLQIQGFIILLLIFSHNNILTSLIICMESVEVLAATWHTKIDSQKDQIRFRNVGEGREEM